MRHYLQQQSGFALVMSMLILVVLTIMGLTSMQGTRTELAMAGNQRESDKAFQIAEIGLISAEEFIENAIAPSDFNNTEIGLYSDDELDPDYFDDDTWESAQESELPESTLKEVYGPPKFVIKYLIDRSQNEVAKINIGGYGTAQPGMTVSYFRTTSKGNGQTDRANRYLQSYYGKAYDLY